MALALNNLKRVDMPLNKETKPNLYFKMAVMPLVPETKMADVGKLISHVVSTHNYVCTFDFVLRIWSWLHDKDCLYILSSSKNTLSPFWLTETTHSLSHFHLQRQHTLSLSYILTSSSQPHENVYFPQPFSFLFCLFR